MGLLLPLDETLPPTSKEVRFLTGGPNPLGRVQSISPEFGPPVESQGKRQGSPSLTNGSAQGAHKKHAPKRETKVSFAKASGEGKRTRASTIWGWAEIRGSSPQPFIRGSSPQPFQERSQGCPWTPQVVHPLCPPQTLSTEESSSARQANRGSRGSP